MSTTAYAFISMALKTLGERVEELAAERDELRRERDELRAVIESAGRVLAGKEKNDAEH